MQNIQFIIYIFNLILKFEYRSPSQKKIISEKEHKNSDVERFYYSAL